VGNRGRIGRRKEEFVEVAKLWLARVDATT
jgi:hypothetical protein